MQFCQDRRSISPARRGHDFYFSRMQPRSAPRAATMYQGVAESAAAAAELGEFIAQRQSVHIWEEAAKHYVQRRTGQSDTLTLCHTHMHADTQPRAARTHEQDTH